MILTVWEPELSKNGKCNKKQLGFDMRCAVLAFLLSVTSVTAQAEPASSKFLQGEWHQVASNAGKCADCRIVIGQSGEDFTVKANNGWSAVVRRSSKRKLAFMVGKGSWDSNFGGVYGGRTFSLKIGMKGDSLLMLMKVPGRSDVKSIFKKETSSRRAS